MKNRMAMCFLLAALPLFTVACGGDDPGRFDRADAASVECHGTCRATYGWGEQSWDCKSNCDTKYMVGGMGDCYEPWHKDFMGCADAFEGVEFWDCWEKCKRKWGNHTDAQCRKKAK